MIAILLLSGSTRQKRLFLLSYLSSSSYQNKVYDSEFKHQMLSVVNPLGKAGVDRESLAMYIISMKNSTSCFPIVVNAA